MATIVHWGKYYPPDRGGIESVTATLAIEAAKAGHRTSVVCFATDGPGVIETLDDVRVLRAERTVFVASQPLGWDYIRWALKQGRGADLVHLHVPNMLGAFAALFLGAKPKLLVHWHSDVIGKGALGMLLRPLERAMLTRADRIVCTSQPYAEGSAVLRPFLHKVTVVPNGVPDVLRSKEVSIGLPAALANKVAGRRVVLAVGRLVPYKGFGVLVEAAALLPQDVVVLIVGSGPQEPVLSARIEALGLNDKVLMTGHVGQSLLDALYQSAVLFCMPSVERSEAFGLAIVEAMAFRLPVVATRIAGSGVSWVNQHQKSGLNVPVRDPAALAAACNEILSSNTLRASLSEGARQRYLDCFTDKATAAQMLAAYRSMLTGG